MPCLEGTPCFQNWEPEFLDLITFQKCGTDDEVETTDLRTNPSQEGGDDEMPRAKAPTTKAITRRIQEEWALNAHARPKMNFTWPRKM